MLKVDLITVGKLKEDYLRRACEEYQKRLGAFVKLQIIELPEGKMPQDPSAAQIESCLAQEGQSILSKIPAQSFVVAMCIEGQMLSSEQLAETFLRQQTGGISQMSFIIGGSWGLDPAVKQRSNLKLSQLSTKAKNAQNFYLFLSDISSPFQNRFGCFLLAIRLVYDIIKLLCRFFTK